MVTYGMVRPIGHGKLKVRSYHPLLRISQQKLTSQDVKPMPNNGCMKTRCENWASIGSLHV